MFGPSFITLSVTMISMTRRERRRRMPAVAGPSLPVPQGLRLSRSENNWSRKSLERRIAVVPTNRLSSSFPPLRAPRILDVADLAQTVVGRRASGLS